MGIYSLIVYCILGVVNHLSSYIGLGLVVGLALIVSDIETPSINNHDVEILDSWSI